MQNHAEKGASLEGNQLPVFNIELVLKAGVLEQPHL
jgi:hypothetical protein